MIYNLICEDVETGEKSIMKQGNIKEVLDGYMALYREFSLTFNKVNGICTYTKDGRQFLYYIESDISYLIKKRIEYGVSDVYTLMKAMREADKK